MESFVIYPNISIVNFPENTTERGKEPKYSATVEGRDSIQFHLKLKNGQYATSCLYYDQDDLYHLEFMRDVLKSRGYEIDDNANKKLCQKQYY